MPTPPSSPSRGRDVRVEDRLSHFARRLSDAQHEQYLAAVLELDRRDRRRDLSAEEKNLFKLLVLLIDEYENKHDPIRAATPAQVLQELISANNLRQKDLAPLLGSESIVSELVNGTRRLTKTHIEKLSKKFHVSPEVFFSD